MRPPRAPCKMAPPPRAHCRPLCACAAHSGWGWGAAQRLPPLRPAQPLALPPPKKVPSAVSLAATSGSLKMCVYLSLWGRQRTALGRAGVFGAIRPSLRTRRPRPPPSLKMAPAQTARPTWCWGGRAPRPPSPAPAASPSFIFPARGKPQRHLPASTGPGRAGVARHWVHPCGPPARGRVRSKPRTPLTQQGGLGRHLPPPVTQNTSSSQSRPLQPRHHSRWRLRCKPHGPPVGPHSREYAGPQPPSVTQDTQPCLGLSPCSQPCCHSRWRLRNKSPATCGPTQR